MREKMSTARKTVKPRPPKVIAAVLQQKDKQIQMLSQLVILFGAFNAIATLPQAISIWSTRDSGGLSLLSWSYYLVFAIIMLAYGLALKQKPLVVTYSSSAVVYAAVVVGIVQY